MFFVFADQQKNQVGSASVLSIGEQFLIAKHAPPKDLELKLDDLFSSKDFFKSLLSIMHPDCKNKEKLILEKKFPKLRKIQTIKTGIKQGPDCEDLRFVCFYEPMKEFIIKVGVPWNVENVKTKRNIDRIAGVEIVNRYIKDSKSRHLTTPKKYIYHIPGKDLEFVDDNYIVVEEKMDLLDEKFNKEVFKTLVSRSVIREVLRFIIDIHVYDFSIDNFRITSDGKIVIIDTTECFSNGIEWFDTLKSAVGFQYAKVLFRDRWDKDFDNYIDVSKTKAALKIMKEQNPQTTIHLPYIIDSAE